MTTHNAQRQGTDDVSETSYLVEYAREVEAPCPAKLKKTRHFARAAHVPVGYGCEWIADNSARSYFNLRISRAGCLSGLCPVSFP